MFRCTGTGPRADAAANTLVPTGALVVSKVTFCTESVQTTFEEKTKLTSVFNISEGGAKNTKASRDLHLPRGLLKWCFETT